jgi:hypothetical protein
MMLWMTALASSSAQADDPVDIADDVVKAPNQMINFGVYWMPRRRGA